MKALLDGQVAEADKKEWIVVHSGGQLLCTRLADIAWVRAAGEGVELQIGRQSYFVHETFACWEAKLPTDRFARRGTSVLLNVKRLRPLKSALSSVFQRRTAWATPMAGS